MAEDTQVWFITGVNTGFGLELALIARHAGQVVVGSVRSADKFPDVLRRAGVEMVELTMPTTEAAARKVVGSVITNHGRVDVLVNNAGYGHAGWVEETTDAELERQLAVNLISPIALIKAVLPHMRAQRQQQTQPPAGRNPTIVNISSISGHISVEGGGLYAASKHGLDGISESLSLEVAKWGIRILLVVPGNFRTQVMSKFSLGDDYGERRLKDVYPTSAAQNYSNFHDKQPGDPQRGMQLVYDCVTGTGQASQIVTRDGKPLLRLFLGSDAVEVVSAQVQSIAAEVDACKSVAMATDFPK